MYTFQALANTDCIQHFLDICLFQSGGKVKGIVSKLTIKFWMCQKMWQNERLQQKITASAVE
jgi:hypothetical protein